MEPYIVILAIYLKNGMLLRRIGDKVNNMTKGNVKDGLMVILLIMISWCRKANDWY